MAGGACVRVDDWALAQALADTLSPDPLHRTLGWRAKLYCPVSDVFGQSDRRRLMQVGIRLRSGTTVPAPRSARSMSNWSAVRC